MIGKLLVVVLTLFLLVGGVYILDRENVVVDFVEDKYHGPIPLDYDLEYFRETGETVREVIINGE